MNKIIIIFALLFAASATPSLASYGGGAIAHSTQQVVHPANQAPTLVAGNNCAMAAQSVAASHYGAQILSAERNGNQCVIVIRVPGQNGYPPRIITKTVSG